MHEQPRYWLIIERKENWAVDKENGFSFFGVPSRHERQASNIRKGDYLLCYVSSGISAFSDVRQSLLDGIKRIRRDNDYDTPYAFCIETKPHIVLPENLWIHLKDIIHDIDLTRDRKEWRQIFRTSLRLLSQSDGERLMKLLRNRAQSLKYDLNNQDV